MACFPVSALTNPNKLPELRLIKSELFKVPIQIANGRQHVTRTLSSACSLPRHDQLLDKHASPNMSSNTSKFNNILEHDLFLYRLRHRWKSQLRLCPGETSHRERSGLTATCGCLFGFVCKKKPTKLERFSREESSQRAPPFFLWMVGV